MNEEEKQATGIAKTQEETEAPEEEKSTPSSPLGGRSVFAYLAVLFGVAFLLLLFAYLMQQRDSQEITGTLSQLRESMGSIESIDQLLEENRALREEVESLKGETAQLQEERDDLEKQLDELQERHAELSDDFSDQYKKVHGWQNFWELEESFLSRDYEACAHILQALANAGSLNLPDSDSALARMREICDTLVDQDYLAEDDPAVRLFGAPEAAE